MSIWWVRRIAKWWALGKSFPISCAALDCCQGWFTGLERGMEEGGDGWGGGNPASIRGSSPAGLLHLHELLGAHNLQTDCFAFHTSWYKCESFTSTKGDDFGGTATCIYPPKLYMSCRTNCETGNNRLNIVFCSLNEKDLALNTLKQNKCKTNDRPISRRAIKCRPQTAKQRESHLIWERLLCAPPSASFCFAFQWKKSITDYLSSGRTSFW